MFSPAVCPEGGLLRSSFLIASDLSLLYSAHRARRGFDFALNCSGVSRKYTDERTCKLLYEYVVCVIKPNGVNDCGHRSLEETMAKTSALDGLVKVYSIKQQSRSTSVRSGNMSHVGTAAFHDHLDRGLNHVNDCVHELNVEIPSIRRPASSEIMSASVLLRNSCSLLV